MKTDPAQQPDAPARPSGRKRPADRPTREEPDTLNELPIASITVGPQMIREDPNDDSIVELASDIARRGLLQPIGVAPLDGGTYQLLWGSRRLLACQRMGRATILARIFDPKTDPIKAIALVENLQRRSLTIAEEIDAVKHLHHESNFSPDQIAAQLSKSRSWVLRRLEIDSYPDDLKQAVLNELLPLGAADRLARIDDPATRQWLANEYHQQHWTLPQLRLAIDQASAYQPDHAEIERAADAATHAPAPQPILIHCPACQRPVELQHTQVLRVCADSDGCAAAQHEQE